MLSIQHTRANKNWGSFDSKCQHFPLLRAVFNPRNQTFHNAPPKINKILILLHILVHSLFALTTALHYSTTEAQDEKILADESLYSTCSSLFLHK